MKHRLRSKSWLCFQARTGDDDSSDFYNNNNNNNMPSVASENSLSKMSTTSSTRSRKRFPSRRTISKIIRAVVLLETPRKKSKKVGQDPYQALTAIPGGKKHHKEDEDGSRRSKDSGTVANASYSTSSSISCSSTSSSSSSSSSSNLSNLSEQRKSFQSNSFESQESDMIKRPYSSINGLVLLVITLMVLVFWGRICAVISTSTWIYFGSVGRRREDEVTLMNSKLMNSKHHNEEEMKSKEYKKRVIMGGLLERKRSRI